MLNVTDLRNGAVFKEAGQVFQVLSYEHTKMGRGSGNVKVKVRNLKSGATTEKSFITGARVEEANIEKKKAKFLYQDGQEFAFMDPVTFEQFSVNRNALGEQARFLREGLEVTLVLLEGEGLGVELPITLVYQITETGPGERGNTVSNVYKDATLDNGLVAKPPLVVKVPMFMNIGDKVRVDTRTGEYVERVR